MLAPAAAPRFQFGARPVVVAAQADSSFAQYGAGGGGFASATTRRLDGAVGVSESTTLPAKLRHLMARYNKLLVRTRQRPPPPPPRGECAQTSSRTALHAFC